MRWEGEFGGTLGLVDGGEKNSLPPVPVLGADTDTDVDVDVDTEDIGPNIDDRTSSSDR